LRRCRGRFGGARLGSLFLRHEAQPAAELERDVVVEGAGVSLLVRDSEFRQQIDDHVRFDLEFAGQLVDSNLTHIGHPGGHG
jgi:hypothetical protein